MPFVIVTYAPHQTRFSIVIGIERFHRYQKKCPTMIRPLPTTSVLTTLLIELIHVDLNFQ